MKSSYRQNKQTAAPIKQSKRPGYWQRYRKNISLTLQLGGLGVVFGSPLFVLLMHLPDNIALLGFAGMAAGFLCSAFGTAQSFQWMSEVRNAIKTENLEQIGLIAEALGQRQRWGRVAHVMLDRRRDSHRLERRPLGHPTTFQTAQQQRDEFYTAINDVLIWLLPQLQSGDLVLFTKEQRAALHRGLQDDDSYLVAALLTGLVQMDDQSAIPAVAQLANGQWRAKYDTSLRTSAQNCLEQFQINREREQNRQILLRATNTSDISPETLLHAVSAPDQTPEQLLRASEE